MTVLDLYENNRFIQDCTIAADWFTMAKEIDVRFKHDYYTKNILPLYDNRSDLLSDLSVYLQGRDYEISGMYATMHEEYDMLDMYDMTEELDNRGNIITTSTTNTAATTAENVTTYDSNTLKPNTQNISDGTDTTNVTITDTKGYLLHRSGNIGAQTSQHLLDLERGIRNFDFVNYVCEIIAEFITECRW